MQLKILILFFFGAFIVLLACSSVTEQQTTEPWSNAQLMEPAELAKRINDSTVPRPIIYSIGPGGYIKGEIEIGPAQEKENIKKLRTALSSLTKDAEIVIFCGCCPFKDCPNVRPAFRLLNEMKFTNHKLLNLSQNIKVDWIDQGYPKN